MAGGTRAPRHPREARTPAPPDLNTEIPGPDLNSGDDPVQEPPEDRHTDRPTEPADRSSSSSSSQPPPPRDAAAHPPPDAQDGPPARSRRRGPDLVERQPRQDPPRMVERAVGENPSDWTSFDVSRSLRMIRTGTPSQVTREIRKLHLRWWHAPRVPMERILSAAGLPAAVVAQVADVVESCRECRIWRSPGPSPSATVELVTKQNTSIEADILFYRNKMVWHMLDRADRFETAIEISSKTSSDLCEAIDVCWISVSVRSSISLLTVNEALARQRQRHT